MDRLEAIKLTGKYRGNAQSQESQVTVARRAGRTYGAAGIMFVGIAVIILVDHATGNTLTVFRICLAACVFAVGAWFCGLGYRFRQAAKALTDEAH